MSERHSRWQCVCAAVVTLLVAAPVRAQTVPPVAAQGPHAHELSPSEAAHDAGDMPPARDGSGTSWLPDDSPMYAIHAARGGWQLMGHESAFIQFLTESGDRGADQFGSINWVMGMARRSAGRGRLTVRGMLSLEPWTIRGCGYPDLLASGERCDGKKIHDRQHPHDLFMELAAAYDAPLAGGVRWQVYGGPAGEPALGPVAFPHRLSAMTNPLAPMTHHWLDSTHVTFGLVTGGLYGARWKAEGSVFNGREPDETRTDLDFGALDSVSGRLWFAPTSRVVIQVSAGRLTEAEAPDDPSGAGTDVARVTSSLTYHAALRGNGLWATTVAWGRNQESSVATHGFLAETTVTLADRDTWFGRVEAARKTAHDLDLGESEQLFSVAKLQGGYTRALGTWKGLTPGIGGTVSAGFVPEALKAAYGSRVNVGVGVFASIRTARMEMTHGKHRAVPMDPRRIRGEIVSVNGEHLTVRTDGGQTVMVMLTASTSIRRGQATLSAEMLRAGDQITVEGTGEVAMITATTVQLSSTPR